MILERPFLHSIEGPEHAGAEMSSVSEIERHIGRRLLAARRLRGISQDALARELGTTRDEIHACEQGHDVLTAARLHDLAQALQVSVSFFYEGLDGKTSCPYSLTEEHYTLLTDAVRRIAADHEVTFNGLRKKLALRDAIKFARTACDLLGWRYAGSFDYGIVLDSQGGQHKASAVEQH
jgi:transcriptional regulator with XRE-family HTH domain